MLFYRIKILSYVLLLAFLVHGCTDPHISDVRIERFEKLDEQPGIESYLVYGYHESIEQEIEFIIDKYVCDSIFPNITIERASRSQQKNLFFFKKTKNSNNEETYLSKIKRSIAYRDVIVEYVFRRKEDSTIVPAWKTVSANEPEVTKPFKCD